MFRLHIEDLDLGLLEPRHAAQLLALLDANRDHLTPWFPWMDDLATVEAVATFLEGRLRRFAERGEPLTGILFGGNLAGCAWLHDLNPDMRSVQLGYWVAAGHRGKGLATRASQALVSYAFDELGMHRVEAWCAADNVASRRVPERLGFTLEGTLRDAELLRGRFGDMVVYGMLEPGWRVR